jgi:hypothetical protein
VARNAPEDGQKWAREQPRRCLQNQNYACQRDVFTISSSVRSKFGDLQNAICEASALEEPLINEADARGEEKATGEAVHKTLGHDHLHSLDKV